MNITDKLDKYLIEMEVDIDIGPEKDEQWDEDDVFSKMADFMLSLDDSQLTDDQADAMDEIFGMIDELGDDDDDVYDKDDTGEYDNLDFQAGVNEVRMAKKTSASSKRKSKSYYRKFKMKIRKRKKKFKRSAAGHRRDVARTRLAKQNKSATGRKKVKYH